MADGITIKIDGLDTMKRDLDALTSDLRKKTIRAALKDASKPIIAAAKASTAFRDYAGPRRAAGTLRKNIRVANSRKFRGQDGVLGVFISVKATKAGRRKAPVTGDPFYYRWVEGGHLVVPRRGRKLIPGTRAMRRASAARGGRMVAPRPFLGPAFASQGQTALRIFQERIAARIAVANAAR